MKTEPTTDPNGRVRDFHQGMTDVADALVKHYSQGMRELTAVVRKGRRPTEDDLYEIWRRALLRVCRDVSDQAEIAAIEAASQAELTKRYPPGSFPSIECFRDAWRDAMRRSLGAPIPQPDEE